MRRSIPILSIIVLLAAGAAYFLLRDRHDVPATVHDSIAPAAPVHRDAPPQTTAGVAPHPATPAKSASDAAEAARAQAEEAAALRARLADPEIRQQVLNRIMETYSTDSPAGFNHYVGLRDDEYMRLMNLLTDQQIERFRAQLECAENPSCDQIHVMQTLAPEQYRERTQLLGPERTQRLENYIDYDAVRGGVGNLRSMLPESQRLGDAQADKLAEALAAERHLVIEEIKQRGTTPSTVSSLQGQIVIPLDAQGVDQKFDAAQEYQQRMNDRAAEFLNPQQLAVFKDMQATWLAKVRLGWEREAAGPGAH